MKLTTLTGDRRESVQVRLVLGVGTPGAFSMGPTNTTPEGAHDTFTTMLPPPELLSVSNAWQAVPSAVVVRTYIAVELCTYSEIVEARPVVELARVSRYTQPAPGQAAVKVREVRPVTGHGMGCGMPLPGAYTVKPYRKT